MDALFSSANAPFLAAIGLMMAIGVIEGLSLLIGAGLSHHLDSYLAHDLHPGLDSLAGDGLLGWLHVGRAPILVLLVIFLMGFAIGGLALQFAVREVIGHPLPPVVASLVAVVFAVPVVRVLGGRIAHHVPKDETTAVSEESFIGRIARLTAESAGTGQPGQARLTDEHGQPHYLLVEPDDPQIRFARGDSLLVVSRASASVFRAIRNPRPDLL